MDVIRDKRRCEDGPILFAFFLRFLIRNKVFAETEISRGLQRALTVCELARVELPATFVISKALEDGISKGFQELYGTMTNGFEFHWPDAEEDTSTDAANDDNDERRRKGAPPIEPSG